MSKDWRKMGQRLRENSDRNLADYDEQANKADARIKDIERIHTETAQALAASRRNVKRPKNDIDDIER